MCCVTVYVCDWCVCACALPRVRFHFKTYQTQSDYSHSLGEEFHRADTRENNRALTFRKRKTQILFPFFFAKSRRHLVVCIFVSLSLRVSILLRVCQSENNKVDKTKKQTNPKIKFSLRNYFKNWIIQHDRNQKLVGQHTRICPH